MNKSTIFAVLAALAAVAAFVFAPAVLVPVHADAEDADPPPACPFATGTLAQNMANRVVRTAAAGFLEYEYAEGDVTEATISLEHALHPAWTCATWSVELLAPPGAAVQGASARTGLTRSDAATFQVELVEMHDEAGSGNRATGMGRYERHEHRAVFAVEVFNGGDVPVAVDGESDAQGRWHFPVVFRLHRR